MRYRARRPPVGRGRLHGHVSDGESQAHREGSRLDQGARSDASDERSSSLRDRHPTGRRCAGRGAGWFSWRLVGFWAMAVAGSCNNLIILNTNTVNVRHVYKIGNKRGI